MGQVWPSLTVGTTQLNGVWDGLVANMGNDQGWLTPHPLVVGLVVGGAMAAMCPVVGFLARLARVEFCFGEFGCLDLFYLGVALAAPVFAIGAILGATVALRGRARSLLGGVSGRRAPPLRLSY
jgi:hypothetical protein